MLAGLAYALCKTPLDNKQVSRQPTDDSSNAPGRRRRGQGLRARARDRQGARPSRVAPHGLFSNTNVTNLNMLVFAYFGRPVSSYNLACGLAGCPCDAPSDAEPGASQLRWTACPPPPTKSHSWHRQHKATYCVRQHSVTTKSSS